jgi:hypothetical protein
MIGSDAATILYSGSRAAFEQHRATLDLLSGPRFVGDAPEAAAVWDLALFGVWYDAQLGLLRALDAVRAAGMDVAGFAGPVGVQLGHVVTELRAGRPLGDGGLSQVAARIETLIADGRGGAGLTATMR